MDLAPGTQLTVNLRLVRRLGQGGMGTVWIAHHEGLAADVVVKFISETTAKSPEVLARFSREAAAASQVKSPHVVHMIDHGVTRSGLPYIAMELLEGEDLARRLWREKKLPPGEVAAIIAQVARALSRAHEKGIIHRDIKPENVFLCDTGEGEAFVKVLDFGIAKFTPTAKSEANRDPSGFSLEPLDSTTTGTMVGTASYMSPEQVVGAKTIDHRTDIWSLGVVAFQALTGIRPFAGDTIGAVSLRICTGPLPMPSTLNPALPLAVDEWFAKACARELDERFTSARAMAKALEDAIGGVGPIPETGPATVPETHAPMDPTKDDPLPGSLLRRLGGDVPVTTTIGTSQKSSGRASQEPAPALEAKSEPRTNNAPLIATLVVTLLLVSGFAIERILNPHTVVLPAPSRPSESVASPSPTVVTAPTVTASASAPSAPSVLVGSPPVPSAPSVPSVIAPQKSMAPPKLVPAAKSAAPVPSAKPPAAKKPDDEVIE